MSCAMGECTNGPDCPVCSVPLRFPTIPREMREGDGDLKHGAPALNGTKPARTNRDPRFIKRRRVGPNR